MKMVGFAHAVKLSWLNYAVEILSENYSVNEYKEALNQYLGFEIDSPTQLRKTRDILMNTWYYEKDAMVVRVRSRAIELLKKHPEAAPAIHLGMLYLTYPVVADVCRYMGRILEFQDDVTTSMLSKKLHDEWGERGALSTTARRVTLTLKELGLLTAISRTRYAVNKLSIAAPDVANHTLQCAMIADEGTNYPFTGLEGIYELFPFDMAITKEQLMNDERFILSSFDGQLNVSVRR